MQLLLLHTTLSRRLGTLGHVHVDGVLYFLAP